MYEYFFYAYVTAIGFCLAGAATSLSHLVTGQPLRFGIGSEPAAVAVLGVIMRVIAGPAIVMRNAVKAALGGRPPYWLALSTMISVLWSFFSGVVILELLYRLSA